MLLSNSFDNWIFYDGLDVNNTGAVIFQSQDEATQNKLIFNTDSGTTIIKVDNTTNGQGNSSFGRGSIKVLSQYTFTTGNLLLFDALHMPYGVKRIMLNLQYPLLTVISFSDLSARYGPRCGRKVPYGQTTARLISLKASTGKPRTGFLCILWTGAIIPLRTFLLLSKLGTSFQPTASTGRTSTKVASSRSRAHP